MGARAKKQSQLGQLVFISGICQSAPDPHPCATGGSSLTGTARGIINPPLVHCTHRLTYISNGEAAADAALRSCS
jgi:hypothetical protein